MSRTRIDPSLLNILSSSLNLGSNKITNLANGTVSTDAVNLSQITAANAGALALTGGTLSGTLNLGTNTITNLANGTVSGNAVNFGQLSNTATNILINGGFEFWQRGTSFSSPADSTVQADRWTHYQNGAPVYTVSQESGAGNVDSGQYSFKLNITSVGGSTSFQYRQYVEDYFPYLNKPISLSVRVKSNAALRVAIYDGITFTASSPHSGGGTFETLTVTATPSSSANQVDVVFGFGTNATGTPVVSTSYIDSAMLVLGSEPINFVAKNYETELAQCQRYYEKSYNIETSPATNTALGLQRFTAVQIGVTSVITGTVPFKVTKRAAPTITLYTQTGTSGSWTWASTADIETARVTSVSSADRIGFVGEQVVALEFWGYGHWTAEAELI